MPIVISAIQEKGGSGKTMALALLAAHYAHAQKRVAIIDTDPQQTLRTWTEEQGNENFPISYVEAPAPDYLPATIAFLDEKADIVLIDTAGVKTAATFAAAAASHIVLIPSRAAKADFLGALKTLAWLNHASERHQTRFAASVVLSDYKPQTNMGRWLVEQLHERGVPYLHTPIHSRAGLLEFLSIGGRPVGTALAVAYGFVGALENAHPNLLRL
ncbi:ParA family protein [Magnetospira sp. QH-2]|uniref:ParA family protein n=1 Tax=Magnetospira sp. (strain QH-2) TaxID=1288970 RepID=UPI0003E80D58|nr:ParA family protein [Magnetospira sp. QH-2]CCQ75774.1 Conserved protein of unknown function. Similar to ParA protein, putative from Oceanicola batsensis HTCC2597 [Magnetospira sp. QH-2]